MNTPNKQHADLGNKKFNPQSTNTPSQAGIGSKQQNSQQGNIHGQKNLDRSADRLAGNHQLDKKDRLAKDIDSEDQIDVEGESDRKVDYNTQRDNMKPGKSGGV